MMEPLLLDKIVVGTPVRTVQAAGIPGVDPNWGRQNGAVLVYNANLLVCGNLHLVVT